MATNPEAIDEFTARLATLEPLFDLETLERRSGDRSDIARYYVQSRVGYKLVHSRAGAIHMSLSEDGEFREAGYEGSPSLVASRLPSDARLVLELGCGNGFNLAHVARATEGAHVIGIDIVHAHVRAAQRTCARVPNASATWGDFADLPFAAEHFDALFSIESFCHALDVDRAFAEARRVARPGAYLIVIDAWRTDGFWSPGDPADPDPQTVASAKRAAAILERAMSVGNAQTYSGWVAAAERAGWAIDESLVLDDAVMPNLAKLERSATKLVSRPRAARISSRVLPGRLVGNVVAGYLIAQSVRAKVHEYRLVVLRAT